MDILIWPKKENHEFCWWDIFIRRIKASLKSRLSSGRNVVWWRVVSTWGPHPGQWQLPPHMCHFFDQINMFPWNYYSWKLLVARACLFDQKKKRYINKAIRHSLGSKPVRKLDQCIIATGCVIFLPPRNWYIDVATIHRSVFCFRGQALWGPDQYMYCNLMSHFFGP